MKKPVVLWLSVVGLTMLLVARPAFAADVQVMISSGFYGAYSELGPAFERASGHHLVTTRGPSMGDSSEAIPARLARGEAADLVILDGNAAEELGRKGLVRADGRTELARSLIGMVVREGAAKPDIGSVESFRQTLLAAKSIRQRQRHLSFDHTVCETRRCRTGRAQEPESAGPAIRGAGGSGCRARRSRDRFPAGERADPCWRCQLRRHDSGRTSAKIFLCRRADEHGAPTRGRGRADPVPRFARRRASDPEGRSGAAWWTIGFDLF